MNKDNSFIVKDHSVSGEEFSLRFNADLDMYETHPQPALDQLDRYYESDDYISHTNSKRNLFEHIYHLVRSFMIGSKLKLVKRNTKTIGSLLDIGCGTGDFLSRASKSGWKVKGIEPNQQARAIAKEKNLDVYDVNELNALAENSIDCITLWHVLEHLPNLDEHIEVIRRLLKPGGLLVIAVPNYKSYDAQYYQTNWAAYDVPRHLWHFSKKSIKMIFGNKGFELLKVKPMFFDSFYVSILSSKYARKRFSLINGFVVGTWSNLKGLFSGEFSSHIYVLRSKKPKRAI